MSLTDKQEEYLQSCDHRWNVKIGATGSGKSFLDYAVTIPKRILAAKGEGLIVLLGNTRGTLERNILSPMREIWTPELVGMIRSDNTVSIFGRRVYALGADSKKHVARIQGATIEYAYGDEITTWSQEVFRMLQSRLRCEHSHFDGTCNPGSPNHWFKAFLESDADIYEQRYVIDDGVLPQHIVEQLKKEYEGTVYYKRYILGEWALAEGLIYPRYEEALGTPPEHGQIEDYCLSIDYGTLNAFAAMLWEKYRNGDQYVWWCNRIYYYSGRDTGIQKTDAEYGDALDKLVAPVMQARERDTKLNGTPFQKMRTIIDPSAASFIALLRRKSWYKVIQADNAVLDGIMETQRAMYLGRIKINPNTCPEWVSEAQGYVWDEDAGEDRPVKVADHCLSGDTLVLTESGYKKISEMVGTSGRVWSYNTTTKTAELKDYHDCRMTSPNASLLKITFDDGRVIRCTEYHPILTVHGYVMAKDLVTGDEIMEVR